jgi:hypothetical protein
MNAFLAILKICVEDYGVNQVHVFFVKAKFEIAIAVKYTILIF